MGNVTKNPDDDITTYWFPVDPSQNDSSDNTYLDTIVDMQVGFFKSGAYSADWSTVSLPSSPSFGKWCVRVNTDASNQMRVYYYNGLTSSWESIAGGSGPALTAGDNLTLDGTTLNVTIATIGAPTYVSLQDMINTLQSAGAITGGIISDGGSETINVAAGTGFIRDADSPIASLLSFDWIAETGLSIPTDTSRHVGIEYNAGSPQVIITADHSDFNEHDNWHLGDVVNEGGTLHIQNIPHNVGNLGSHIIERFTQTEDPQRGFGLILGESADANRYITVSQGSIWNRLTESAIAGFDTSGADRFDIYHRDGGSGFTKVTNQQSWDMDSYDDGNIATLGANKYAVMWFYMEFDGEVVAQYGRAQYVTQFQAEEEEVPSTAPDRITEHSILIGRLIFKKDTTPALAVETAFPILFNAAGVTSHTGLADVATDSHHTKTVSSDITHNDVGGIDANDIKHLTAAQVTALHDVITTLTHTALSGKNSETNVKHLTDSQVSALHSAVVAGDLNHNDIANLNAGVDFEHITQTQKDALHTAITTLAHTALSGKNSEANIKHLTDAQITALHDAYTDADVDAIVLTHKNNASAHHIKAINTDVNWNASTVLQAEAEAGTSTATRKWTAERVKQAIESLGVTISNHNSLGGLNDGTSYEHITQTQKDALHNVITTLTHTSLTGKNSETNIKHLTDAQITALHDIYTDAQVDAIVLTHKNNASAHHIKTTNTDVNWSASTVGQTEAEAGTSTTTRKWTALRVKQAIDALSDSGITEAQAVQAVEDAGLALANAKVITSQDANLAFLFGRTRLDSRNSDVAHFSHRDITGNNDFAVFQDSSGYTIINCKSGQSLDLRNANNLKVRVTSSGIEVTGNIIVSGKVDGVDIANETDFLKLKGISSFVDTIHYHTNVIHVAGQYGSLVQGVLGTQNVATGTRYLYCGWVPPDWLVRYCEQNGKTLTLTTITLNWQNNTYNDFITNKLYYWVDKNSTSQTTLYSSTANVGISSTGFRSDPFNGDPHTYIRGESFFLRTDLSQTVAGSCRMFSIDVTYTIT